MTHEYFMTQALKEAQNACNAGEVPVGAVIVMKNKIIARGCNQVEKLNDATAHAEMIALTSAFNYLGAKYIPEATLYVTIEPCLMCAGAIFWGKIGTLVYGANDEKNGYKKFMNNSQLPFPPKTIIIPGIHSETCATLMKSFFKARR